jgi:F420H(2)-dependent quinone reductase
LRDACAGFGKEGNLVPPQTSSAEGHRSAETHPSSIAEKIGATRPGTWAIKHVVSPLQRRVLLATGGRVSLTGDLPVLLLTATGRRSGRPRTVPLIFLRDGDDLVVCNVRPPSERPNPWPLNVRADPSVSVRIGGVTEQRVAREASDHQIAKYWPLLVQIWPAYASFFAETHERAIFVLQRPRDRAGPRTTFSSSTAR